MCRFSGPEDVEYKKVVTALQLMTANMPKGQVLASGSSITTEQRQKLLDSLAFDQIDTRYSSIKKAHAKTCKWLEKKAEYLDWLDPNQLAGHHGFLWVKGNPGAGKSTLMKFALGRARRTLKDWTIVSFFFNPPSEKLEKSTARMYRSLLSQLLRSVPTLETIFDSLQLTMWRRDSQIQWSLELLKDLFEQAVQSLGRSQVVCFIDTLDECDEGQIRDMLSSFERIGEAAMASNVRFQVCFSSRYYPNVTMARSLNLALEESQEHEQDIANYVDSELKIGYSVVAEEVKAELRDKASSIFLWSSLVVDILNKEYDRSGTHALRKRLREIPTGLHDLLREILTQDAHDRDKLLLCIQWVLFATRPLQPEELYFAVLAKTDLGSLEPWNQDLRTIDSIQRFILDASKGLAKITKTKPPVVQFIHESVRDFLLKGNGLGELRPDLGDQLQGLSHEQLKGCCLGYISADIAKTLHLPEPLPNSSSKDAANLRSRAEQSYPFLDYAVRNVLYHADQAESHGITQSEFLEKFPLQTWINIDNLIQKHDERRHTIEASLLYILAERNLAHLIRAHFSTSSPLGARRERYENPLFAALVTQSTDAVQALAELGLRNGAGSLTSFRILCQSYLENPPQIPKLDRKHFPLGNSPFSKFSKEYDTGTTQLLLATGRADIDSALKWAVTTGHDTTVKLLLDTRKASGDLKDVKFGELLEIAAQGGRKIAFRLLLDAGEVKRDLENIVNQLLFHAARSSREDMVRLLLDTGKVDVDSKDHLGRTPLALACTQESDTIVKLFLDTGKVEIGSKDQNGRTPLMWAAMWGRDAVVKLLLNTGKVDVNSKDKDGKTPLSWATERGNDTVVKLLLQASTS